MYVPNVDADAGRNVHKGSPEGALDGEGQGLLSGQLEGDGLLLGLEEVLADGLADHGEDAIVAKEYVEAFQKLTALLVAVVLGTEGLQAEDLLDAAQLAGELLDHVLDPGLGFLLDDDANLGLFEVVVVILVAVTAVIIVVGSFRHLDDLVQRMRDLHSDGLGRGLGRDLGQTELDLNKLVSSQQLLLTLSIGAGGLFVILQQSIHSLAKEGGVETIFGQRTDIVCLAAALGFSHGCLLRSILLEDELSKRKNAGDQLAGGGSFISIATDEDQT